MYSAAQVRTGIGWAFDSPNLLFREVNRLYHTRLSHNEFNPRGLDVMAEDWDNLLLLDACRYDLFERHHDLPGSLTARESRAAHTSEFILGNFHGRDLRDTVYVTASPVLRRGYPERYDPTFHAVVDVWQEAGWNEEWNTVLPETMVEHAVEALEAHPRKRLFVHFMQPHYPFIGSDLELDKSTVPDPEEITTDIWHEMMRGRDAVPGDAVRDAYRGNLDVVLPHVEDLLDTLSGKTVVTSDHGNMFGERSRPIPVREWGHPKGIYTPELVTVPWLEHVEGPRRDVVAEPPASTMDARGEADEDVVADRLRHLGYAE